MEKKTVVLFIITLILALLYVLLSKTLGFIILSTVILYTLEYLYTTIDEQRKPLSSILGGAGTLAVTIVFYILMRLLTKTLGRMARKGALPSVFSSSTLNAVISLVFVLLSAVLLYFVLCKSLKKIGYQRVVNAGLLSFTVVLILFVVFKQFFLVALAPGLLNF